MSREVEKTTTVEESAMYVTGFDMGTILGHTWNTLKFVTMGVIALRAGEPKLHHIEEHSPTIEMYWWS